MSIDRKPSSNCPKAFIIFASALLATLAWTSQATPNLCGTLVPLTPGETWRDPGRGIAERLCFHLDVETPGILTLDLYTDTAAPPAWLVFDGAGRLQQSATSLVLDAAAATYLVRVESQDPRQPLPAFRLTTRFAEDVSRSETDSEIEVEPDPFSERGSKSETDSEIEVEPDPFSGCGSKSETDSEIEVEPDPLTEPTPKIHDLARLPAVLRPYLAELCQRESGDDHGDGSLCATGLTRGQAVDAKLFSDWGDDRDVFRFRVETLAPIAIDARGNVELAVELHDQHGQRLASTVGDRVLLVRSLVPGVYFIRLQGAGGDYSLELSRADKIGFQH